MNYQELLDIATRVGFYLLENGAEIYRVEDSIRAIVNTYGVEEVDVYAVPTSIIVTITPPDAPSMTKTKRIYTRQTDLDKIYKLNTLSYSVVATKPSLSEIEESLNEINARPNFSLLVQTMAYALAAFGFTLFFGGNFIDALCSLTLGATIRILSYFMDQLHTNSFFTNTICSGATALLAIFWVQIGVAMHMDKMIIGAMMNLVPGVAITNSMRDIIAGDLIAGQAKLTEALLAATAMALGAGLVLSLNRLF